MSRLELARKLQATCAVLRSFLGPHKALKCIIDVNSDARNCLVGTAHGLLLAADGDPTATHLLLDALEDAPSVGPSPGSGATWLGVLCGMLLDHMLQLVEIQGVPYESVRSGILQAVGECCQAIRDCALELPLVAELWDEQELVSYYQAVSVLMAGVNEDEHHDEGVADGGGTVAAPAPHPHRPGVALQMTATASEAATAATPCSGFTGSTAVAPPGSVLLRHELEAAGRVVGQERHPPLHSLQQQLQPAAAAAASTSWGPGRVTQMPSPLPPPLPQQSSLRSDEQQSTRPLMLQSPPPPPPQQQQQQPVCVLGRCVNGGHIEPHERGGGAGGGGSVFKEGRDGKEHLDVDDEFGWFDEMMMASAESASAKDSAMARPGKESSGGGGLRLHRGTADLVQGREGGMALAAETASTTAVAAVVALVSGDAAGGAVQNAAEAAAAIVGLCGPADNGPERWGRGGGGGGGSRCGVVKDGDALDDGDDDSGGGGKDDDRHYDIVFGDGDGGRNGDGLLEEVALVALEEEVAWFFGEGELQAEREARAVRRRLRGRGRMAPELAKSRDMDAAVGGSLQRAPRRAATAGPKGPCHGNGDGDGDGDGRRYNNNHNNKGNDDDDDDDDDGFSWFDEMRGERGFAQEAAAVAAGAAPTLVVQEQQQQTPKLLTQQMQPPSSQPPPVQSRRGASFLRPNSGLVAVGDNDGDDDGFEPRDVTGGVSGAVARVAAGAEPAPPPPPALPPRMLYPSVHLPAAAAAAGPALTDSAACEWNNAAARRAVSCVGRDGKNGSGGSAVRHCLSPLSHLVCAAAIGLSHGRCLEMQLAAAALLLLIGPRVRQPCEAPPSSAGADAAAAGTKQDLREVAEQVRQVAGALQYERCVLTAELMGRLPSAVAAMRGVVVPLAALSPLQAALAANFFPELAASSSSSSPSAAAVTLTAVFYHGALQPEHAAYGTVIVTDAAGLAAATADARAEAFTVRLLAALRPLGVQMLLASGHVPDHVAAALHQLSGGTVLALGGAGLRAVRAAAACCGVTPAASWAFLDGCRHVAPRVSAELLQGGLGLEDYRATTSGRRHIEAAVLLRLMAAPAPTGAAATAAVAPPGWVTVILAHSVTVQLETQGACFRNCFNRLLAALQRGHVLPGAGAWELATAEHLTRRAEHLQVQRQLQRGGGPQLQLQPPSPLLGSWPPSQTLSLQGSQGSATLGRREMEAVTDAKRDELQGSGEEGEDDDGDDVGRQQTLYLPLSYRAVAAALRDLVGVLLQNGGATYGDALAAAAACVKPLREGDAEQLARLAAAPLAPAAAPELDECRQLAAALRVMMELKGTAASTTTVKEDVGLADVPNAGQRRLWPPLVLDELGARLSGLRGACRLALLASSVDRVIVNR
ncbi:hypothetical protein VOLCADRAFT_118388 [Volvox carteri f. nagariensis]|uniref:Uncharacterized protein n=1 Tax=Volvox carteri f. nagariensis TaxID=3068 RepID=D8U4J6_VOLCA|nr:uncharacterized protein VOLCADRAFT_118388 [Volvox carteri f. nagariensis]EFJ45202.1 hypothetical protein VOLCADRAFT_118388 [Volvox carteri f. nagariensis]|eukprot:XP_002953578.1 hypothetical protein VOLCADRAFT_118388 [Volvox carteri f. nagariensis]